MSHRIPDVGVHCIHPNLCGLVGEPSRPGKRGPAPKLQQQLQRVQSLPKAQQQAISKVLDSVLAAHQ